MQLRGGKGCGDETTLPRAGAVRTGAASNVPARDDRFWAIVEEDGW